MLPLCACLAAVACRPAPEAQSTRPVAAGCVLRGSVSSDTPSLHPIPAGGRLFVRATLDQLGADLRLELRAGDGSPLAVADGPGGLWIPEMLSAVTSGRAEGLLVAVVAAPSVAEPAPFELRIDELRPADAGDPQRIEIDRMLQEARHLLTPIGEDGAQRARVLLDDALAKARSMDDPVRQALALQTRAAASLSNGRFEDARNAAEHALEVLPATGQERLRASTLGVLSGALVNMGELEAARDALERTEAAAQAPAAASLKAELVRRSGDILYYGGQREAAGGVYSEALEACELTPCNPQEHILLLSNLGVVQRYLGHYGRALAHYEGALAIVERLGDEHNRALLLNNLGVLHATRGDSAEALRHYQETADLAARLGDHSLEARAAGNLALLHSYLGDLDGSLAFAERSLALYREIGSATGEARARMETGWVHERRGEPEQALDGFDQAFQLAAEAQAPNVQALALVGRARSLTAMGDLDAADEAVAGALQLLERLDDVTGRLEALRARGEILIERSALDAADRVLREALALALDLGDVGREAPLRALLSRVARRRGAAGEARHLMETSLNLRESVRTDLVDPLLRASYQSRSLDDYIEYLDQLLDPAVGGDEESRLAAAFEVAERAKARMLVDLLFEAQVTLDRGVPDELLTQRGTVAAKLTSAGRELRRVLDGGADPDAEESARIRREIAVLEQTLDALEWRARRASPRYSDLRYPEPSSLDAARELLDPDTVLLEYALGETRSYLFVVSTAGAELLSLPPRGELRSSVQAMRRSLETASRSGLGSLGIHSAALYDQLLRPVEHILERHSRLVIVPDQELCYLPFESLEDDRRSGRPRVVSRWSVSYAPSVTALARIRQRATERDEARSEFVGFADPELPPEVIARLEAGGEDPAARWPPLPEARREIGAISALFPPRRRMIFLGEDATERRVKAEPAVGRAALLHFAAHTIIDTRRPGRSSLVLGPGEASEDGLLQVHEIFDLDLSARLVVLSGCQTGLGREIRGEGLVGMTQAFFYAGADALVVSLWPVPDRSTGDLMVHLYEELEGGATAATALRRAKLALIEADPRLHPFYWSAFVLVGDRT